MPYVTKATLDTKVARKLIFDLTDASRTVAMAEYQVEEDLPPLRKAERLLDKAIRYAWKEMVGAEVPHGIDPYDFIVGGVE